MRALQGNAGIKLYLTPSDEKTVEELSKAVGKTTKTMVTRSRAVGKNPFEGRSQSERTKEVALLLEPVWMLRSGPYPCRTTRCRPSGRTSSAC